jgi:DNA-binding beta-propeller fold protein YncE
LTEWTVERIIHFGPEDLIKNGLSHFGFHDRTGKPYAVFHQKHFLGLIGKNDLLEWTVAADKVFEETPNISAKLNYPMYIDSLPDDTLVVSNFGNARIYRIDVERRKSELFVDGSKLGMKDVGNCVVDDEGLVWVNEVEGCRIWRFDSTGKPVLKLGDGMLGFQLGAVDFDEAKFSWIYDIRRGPDGNIYVLDSRNFAVRLIDLENRVVKTIAGTGKPGYEGDNGDALNATFGSSPDARFDGPISLSLDEEGNIFVGDRQNHVVRMIHKKSSIVTTIAGKRNSVKGLSNNPEEKDPLKLNLPEISSMDYHDGHLFVPTDLTQEEGDLTVLRRSKASPQ